jgi:hypothetical protein
MRRYSKVRLLWAEPFGSAELAVEARARLRLRLSSAERLGLCLSGCLVLATIGIPNLRFTI